MLPPFSADQKCWRNWTTDRGQNASVWQFQKKNSEVIPSGPPPPSTGVSLCLRGPWIGGEKTDGMCKVGREWSTMRKEERRGGEEEKRKGVENDTKSCRKGWTEFSPWVSAGLVTMKDLTISTFDDKRRDRPYWSVTSPQSAIHGIELCSLSQHTLWVVRIDTVCILLSLSRESAITIRYPTAPYMRRYITLWNINVGSYSIACLVFRGSVLLKHKLARILTYDRLYRPHCSD